LTIKTGLFVRQYTHGDPDRLRRMAARVIGHYATEVFKWTVI